jgi:hypothetical protein
MPILELQSRMYERGRIRIGQKVAAANGKNRPEKLDRFRFTSAAQENLEPIAAAYGGTVREWTPEDGRQQFEVITDSARLPILVPPNPVSQWLELWSGGGCQRRCDGVRDVISDSPCLCDPDPEKRECKPTTRLNVILRDMPGIGVWRLESHGWNAAVELPGLAAFVARADGMVPAFLTLEERVVKKDGRTNRFMVPGIDVDITPSQLLAGTNGNGAAAVAGGQERTAIEAAPVPDYVAAAKAAPTLTAWRQVWERARENGHLTDELKARLTPIGEALAKQQLEHAAAAEPLPGDPDQLWMQIVSKCPEGWTTGQLENDFTEFTGGVSPGDATAVDLAKYLGQLTAGAR